MTTDLTCNQRCLPPFSGCDAKATIPFSKAYPFAFPTLSLPSEKLVSLIIIFTSRIGSLLPTFTHVLYERPSSFP